MTEKRALVTGLGPGTGLAIVRRFAAGGYSVAMVARDADRLRAIQDEIPNSRAFAADVADGPTSPKHSTRPTPTLARRRLLSTTPFKACSSSSRPCQHGRIWAAVL
jgi:NADP-dependent 3-hydroxy acid dehydrogenase YdfG